MRLPRERCFNSFFRRVSNVMATNFSHIERTNLPVLKLTAPKQATDLRVGAWDNTGSLTSGDTYIRHRMPCCWKWHSSKLHSSMSVRLASRRSFFKSRDPHRVGLSNLRSGFAQPESHLTKDALTLTYSKLHPVVLPQVLGKQPAVPQVFDMTKLFGGALHISPKRRPLLGIKRGGATGVLSFAQPIQAIFFEPLDPTLHGTWVLSKGVGHLLTTLSASNQQQSMQSMAIARLVGADNFLLNGDTHYLGVSNFQSPHDGISLAMESPEVYPIMRRYLCRYV